jgi:methylated-DNA-protein-cysteine methyltransferase related protein
MNIRMFLNPNEQSCYRKEHRMKKEQNNKENIFDAIYEVVRAVPKGRVTSYGAVAAAIGAKSGARVVGYAMNASFSAKPKVPAHRVVNRNGMLTGKHHFSPPEKMQQLLEKEGIKVKDDKVVAFDKLFWDPIKELEM